MESIELLKLRRDAAITQPELAKAIGYSRQSITKWERGVHPIPLLAAEAIIKACTAHIPKPMDKDMRERVAETMDSYRKMRRNPGPTGTHAGILAFWASRGYELCDEEKAAIAAAYPDILQTNGATK